MPAKRKVIKVSARPVRAVGSQHRAWNAQPDHDMMVMLYGQPIRYGTGQVIANLIDQGRRARDLAHAYGMAYGFDTPAPF